MDLSKLRKPTETIHLPYLNGSAIEYLGKGIEEPYRTPKIENYFYFNHPRFKLIKVFDGFDIGFSSLDLVNLSKDIFSLVGVKPKVGSRIEPPTLVAITLEVGKYKEKPVAVELIERISLQAVRGSYKPLLYDSHVSVFADKSHGTNNAIRIGPSHTDKRFDFKLECNDVEKGEILLGITKDIFERMEKIPSSKEIILDAKLEN